MPTKNLPIRKIADLFNRDIVEVEREYQFWLNDRKRRNQSLTPNISLLARLSNLSTASISNFLRNQRKSLSEEKYHQLQQLVDIVGYIPNRAAQSLRGQRRNAVGVVAPFSAVSPEFYLEILAGIRQGSDPQGFYQFIFDVTTVEGRDKFFNEMPFLNIVDGLIVVGLYVDKVQLELLNQHHMPVVSVNNQLYHPPVVANIVGSDERVLRDLINQHLIKHHRYQRLALITLNTSNPLKMGARNTEDLSRIARISAYREALRINNLEFDEQLVFRVTRHSFEEGFKTFEKIYELNKQLPPKQQIDAVICMSDTLAAAVQTAAHRKGIQMPVIGFDNLPLAELLNITSVDQGARDIGRLAFWHLHNALASRDREGVLPQLIEEEVEMKMILRSSCGC